MRNLSKMHRSHEDVVHHRGEDHSTIADWAVYPPSQFPRIKSIMHMGTILEMESRLGE